LRRERLDIRSLHSKLRKSLVREEVLDYSDVDPALFDKCLDCLMGTNPFGFPEDLLEDIELLKINLSEYPKPHKYLKEELIRYWNGLVKEDDIFPSTGAMGCIEDINRLTISEGARILGYAPQFMGYVVHAKLLGAVYEYVPLAKEKALEFDPNPLINKIRDNISVIYIDNPNNPTGQVIKLDIIEEIVIEALRKNIIVIVDEAYGDYIGKVQSSINLDYDNLVIIRTFSKGFGLANIRVGYSVIKSRELKRLFKKVYLSYKVSNINELIAVAALKNADRILKRNISLTKEVKKKLVSYLESKGFTICKTAMNVPIFVVHKPGTDLFNLFLSKGILTANGNSFIGLDSSYVRIRIPPKPEELINRLEFT